MPGNGRGYRCRGLAEGIDAGDWRRVLISELVQSIGGVLMGQNRRGYGLTKEEKRV